MSKRLLPALAAGAIWVAAVALPVASGNAGAPGLKDRHDTPHHAYKQDCRKEHNRHHARREDPHYSAKHWKHRHYGELYRRHYDPHVKYPYKPYARRHKYWHYKRPPRRRQAYAWISYDCYWDHRPMRARVWTDCGWVERTVWRNVRICPSVPGYVPNGMMK